MSELQGKAIETLGLREQYRDQYWLTRDPIYHDRLLWRAQSFRHMVHLLPRQSILELGCGQGLLTRQLVRVSRGENPITSVSFRPDGARPDQLPEAVEFLSVTSLPSALAGRCYDFVIATDLLDQRNCAWFLQHVYELLKPGGQVIFYESNPWNAVLKLRQSVTRYFGQADPRRLLSRPALYELMSEVGFIRVFAVYNDFVYAPLTRSLIYLLRNLSILLENTPGLRTLAASILIHAQKPPRVSVRPTVSLCEHRQLRHAVSVVIPCYNEEMNIEPLVTQLNSLYGEYIHEIIPVDDNSQDGTAAAIRRLAEADTRIRPIFRTPPNGVGRAIADGYRAATGRYILSMDCDFQHLLPEIRDLFDAAAKGDDVVVGSRFSRHSVLLNYPFKKIFANRGFHVLAQVLFLRKFRDITNNLKLIRREVVERLQLTQPHFAVNAEIGLQPLLMGYSVKEVPISWINRTPDMGVSSFLLAKVGGGYLQVLFRLWLKTVFGLAGAYTMSKRHSFSKENEKIRTTGVSLSKVCESLTMRQVHSLKNRFVTLSNDHVKHTRFHSQFGEDRYIFEHIDLPERGVFVDIGAGHPTYLSNTYFFEKNGWTGLCVDADPSQIKLLKKERQNVEWAAIAPEEGEIEFSLAYFPTYSSTMGKDKYHGIVKMPFKGTIRVPSMKLETLLIKHNIGAIDLLSIDVEGTELEVWETFDYEKHKPKVLIIEYYTFGLVDNSERIKAFFSKLPYQLVHTTCTNFIFLNLDKHCVKTGEHIRCS